MQDKKSPGWKDGMDGTQKIRHVKEFNRRDWHNVRIRIAFLLIMDACVVALAKFMAVFVRFEFSFRQIPMHFFTAFQQELVPAILLSLAVFACFRLYTSLWEYAGVSECINIFLATLIASILNIVLNKCLGIWMFRSYYVMGFMMTFFGIFGVRFFYRFLRWYRENGMPGFGAEYSRRSALRTMIIGAGDTGAMILREIRERPNTGRNVVCLVDDDPAKQGKYLRGVPIAGGHEDIPKLVEENEIQEIILAIPSVSNRITAEMISIAADTGCTLKIAPPMTRLLDQEDEKDVLGRLREVRVEDLLGREPIEIDMEEIMGYVSGKTVLVTGGGGSIGSELCRQLAEHSPKKLIVVDIYENNAYDLQQELRMSHPEADVEILIASVRDEKRIRQIFEEYRPELVYHAAAHKHVPLMETSPNEAVKNNVFGTLNTARAAAICGVKRFVLISTDKAVNPTNIMGATKRICEMIIQSMNHLETSDTEFVAVRFGNVLASNGSVVKLFEKQIGAGGPVTVTHPEIVRYFMTIPEAVSLVLQAGAYAKGGEIFVFDMGEPVKIDDLARKMIRLAGLVPDRDIQIIYTGLRPGEKLYEEVLMDEEGLQDTANRMIHIGRPIEIDIPTFEQQLKQLQEACEQNAEDIAALVAQIVPTFVRNRN